VIKVLPLTIESLVAILLLLTILYCVRLNRQLRRLKADEKTMQATIAELVLATEKAERAIAGLKATVRDAEETLGDRLRAAEDFADQMLRNTDAGAEVLDRLAQIANARPWLMGVAPAADSRPPAPDPKTIMAAAQALAERNRARVKDKAA
jgi:hypothetical protein